MAGSYVDFVEGLIYGGTLPTNHSAWVAANPSPSGTAWLAHHVDAMLAAFEQWVIAQATIPAVTPWNGTFPQPWDTTVDVPLTAAVNGSFTGVATLDDLGEELRDRFTQVASFAWELGGLTKAPFSFRYWSYMKWAKDLRSQFRGVRVFPTGAVLDRDGTPLSAKPFCDTFNDLHRNWHGATAATNQVTPGLKSTAGQRTSNGGFGLTRAEDFLQFHRDHLELIHRWLARTGQPRLRPIDMGRPGGWPATSPPAVVNPPSPWVYDEASLTAASPLMLQTTVDQVGQIEFGYHVNGHGQNTDIGPLPVNNYVLRFHNWHGWIDGQWWWSEPRFARSDRVTGDRERIFRPVLQSNADFPGLQAISIVRDPLLAADTIHPSGAVGALNLTTGAGVLRMKLYARDPVGRALRMRLTVDVLDGNGTVVAAQTVVVLRTIGPAGDHPLDTEFFEDISLSAAFQSDDPTRAAPAAGFVNGRLRITGSLWVPGAVPDDPSTSPDRGFIHTDVTYVDLVREKQAPDASFYLNTSTYSEDAVAALMSAGQARFTDAFLLVVQDRTSPSVPLPAWPPLVADEVKGLITGFFAASGLFDDIAHPPTVEIWQDTVDAPFTGVAVELQGPPAKEDPALPAERVQRHTYRYNVVFAQVNDAFNGLPVGGSRPARLRATVRDRAGNFATFMTPIQLRRAANPFMVDGPVPWLSTDTRSFAVFAGDTLLGETLTTGQPLAFLQAILTRLNNGTAVGTFDALPTEGLGAALEYSTQITDRTTGATRSIYNFALVKVRLTAATEAQNVRAFFRLFRYAEPSLLFDGARGYRAFVAGPGQVVPLLGFDNPTAGASLRSIPFLADARVDATAVSMQTQTDSNVHTFPAAAGSGERVWYFGAWLDINDATARFPGAYNAANPDGPYPTASVQSIRTLIRDFHPCMVVEIRYDPDPTDPLASPSQSDNLAQRNLMILQTDNPGDPWTRTVEHSFELNLTRPEIKIPIPVDAVPTAVEALPVVEHEATHEHEHDHGGGHGHGGGVGACPDCGADGCGDDGCCISCGGGPATPIKPGGLAMVSAFHFERLVHDAAMSIGMLTHEGARLMVQGDHHAIVQMFGAQASRQVREAIPVVMHSSRWTQTAALVDELLIRWNDLPRATQVRMFLPDVAAEDVVSLRNARHAPPTVHAEGDGVLRLDVSEVTYLPIPPTHQGRIPGLITFVLPEGVRAGQRFVVDITQLRAGAPVEGGGFRVEILVGKADALVDDAIRRVTIAHQRLSLTPLDDRWHPILERRRDTERERARALAARTGTPWVDPTTWTGPDGIPRPVTGMFIRVVLEEIVVLDDSDPLWKGAGEIDFAVRVRSDDNGGQETRTRLPPSGHFKLSKGAGVLFNQVLFEGYVEQHLGIRIDAMERDTFDPDDRLGSYVRVFQCEPPRWLGRYRAGDEQIDPEDVGAWLLRYRIERG